MQKYALPNSYSQTLGPNPVITQVYWLTLSAIWATRRFFKTRLLGPKEEDEWTFGQVLPVLLVVAPLAAILEHFLPCQASNNTRPQSSEQVALLIRGQPEAGVRQDETQVQAQAEARVEAREDVRVEADYQYLGSIEYRGALLLAMAAYIEAGIFFVADLSPGIKEPLTRLGVAFFVLNPILQLFWINCTRWISPSNWSSLIKKTNLGAGFSGLISISVNEFVQISTEKNGDGDDDDSLVGLAVSWIAVVGGLALPIAILRHNNILAGEISTSLFFFSILYPVVLVGSCVTLGTIGIFGSQSPLVFIYHLCVCIFVELVCYGFELFMDKVEMAPKRAVYLRCVLLLCILAALVVVNLTTSIAPNTTMLITSILTSAALWALLGTIVAIFRGRRTMAQDESAALTT